MKRHELNYGYDIEYDVLTANVKDDYKYDHSREINGMIFDFDITGNVIGFEILYASEVFSIRRKLLISPKIEITVSTTKELIKIFMIFDFENNERKLIKKKIINENEAQTGFNQLIYNPKNQ